ncbi:MAG: tRNA glutamyl-Q(34) synthetase GluQRS [Hydrogenophaga sp.]|uniref:tRNA glutamyl-Q(34) synthetase GluQRS n=1 Tax=Hydrogenophaga sp. TaxID=1904254 RepID=UPI002774CC05|nr:tRNA glutamyl-Q(34) synthetase GluQRS [Hydrogenophaga sp.]MDP2417082.1 tRNA glutamyl-Q(34) synthetase GluQRS [Hydrogenophaga sp.]MDZ4188256.1 tRNA glutamyl-Q(34) synthetase GluQRS [Hydrogenophaga sp.]
MVSSLLYRGRFAPSPTGPLHAGSLVAALASWLDARAHGGSWIVRIEDVDTTRCVPGADAFILQQLARCGLISDEPVLWQSQRGALYQQALDALVGTDQAYPCGCSRKDIETALQNQGLSRERHQAAVYPGTCRPERGGLQGKAARAWRFAVNPASADLRWADLRLGPQTQNVATEVGDFVLKRADGLWAYQLAVVVDDAAQGITHVVRGEDLSDNTPRQILLQQALGLPTPTYLHTPLVMGENGEKLSKQNGAQALDLAEPLSALNQAAVCLGLPKAPRALSEALALWTQAWPYQPSAVQPPR